MKPYDKTVFRTTSLSLFRVTVVLSIRKRRPDPSWTFFAVFAYLENDMHVKLGVLTKFAEFCAQYQKAKN